MHREIPELVKWKAGYAADPGVEMLLPKDKIALIKVKELEARIHDLEMTLEITRMTIDAIKEQYKIR